MVTLQETPSAEEEVTPERSDSLAPGAAGAAGHSRRSRIPSTDSLLSVAESDASDGSMNELRSVFQHNRGVSMKSRIMMSPRPSKGGPHMSKSSRNRAIGGATGTLTPGGSIGSLGIMPEDSPADTPSPPDGSPRIPSVTGGSSVQTTTTIVELHREDSQRSVKSDEDGSLNINM